MFLEYERKLDVFRDLPAETRDGHCIELAGNIEIPEEMESVLAHGAMGIGLYRTEFLYIRKKERADSPGIHEIKIFKGGRPNGSKLLYQSIRW